VVAVLGRGLVDPAAPLVRADDLGLLRGDGCFETLLVRDGRVFALDAHLRRLARSAARLELPDPDLAGWRALAEQAVGAWPEPGEAVLRLVLTRGPESGGPPTGYAMLSPQFATRVAQRRHGVHVLTLAGGPRSGSAGAEPWLLVGVKCLSYAVNMAALRYARAEGADDVIFVGADGHVLEGPTASVAWSAGGTLCTVPPTEPILAGITVAELFEAAPAHGLRTATSTATVPDLHAADGVWLVSSLRRAVPVRSLDGRPCPVSPLTNRILAALGVDFAVADAVVGEVASRYTRKEVVQR
jgi:4-amino-4-deoxychorismate lyase